MSNPSQSSPAGQPGAAPAKPPRNPIERLVVWGLIVALVVVTVLEGRARLAYSQSLSHIQDAMDQAEQAEISSFTIDKVPALLVGSPKEEHQSQQYDQQAHYEWQGLFKKYGLQVTYGTYTKVVTGVVSDDAPPPEPRPFSDTRPELLVDDSDGATDDEPGAADGPAADAPRPRFDPLQADADGDGKLSKAEAPGRIGENFDAIDTNQDGFLDATELENRPRPSFGGGRGGERPSGDAGGERQRPALDDAPAATSDGAPAAEQPPPTEAAAPAEGVAPPAAEAAPPTANP